MFYNENGNPSPFTRPVDPPGYIELANSIAQEITDMMDDGKCYAKFGSSYLKGYLFLFDDGGSVHVPSIGFEELDETGRQTLMKSLIDGARNTLKSIRNKD